MAHGASGVIADECVAVERLAIQIAQLHIAIHRLPLAAEDDPHGELMLVVFLIAEREQNALPFVDAAETAVHPRAVVELHAASRRFDIGISFAFNLLDDGGQLARLILFLFLFLILRLILRFAGFFRRADVFFALRFFLPLGLLRRGLGLRLGLLKRRLLRLGLFRRGLFRRGLFRLGLLQLGLFRLGLLQLGLFRLGLFRLGLLQLGLFRRGLFRRGLLRRRLLRLGLFRRRLLRRGLLRRGLLRLGILRRGLFRLGLFRLGFRFGFRLRFRLRFGLRFRLRFRFGFRFRLRLRLRLGLRLRLDIHRLAADRLLLRARLFGAVRLVRLLLLALRVGMAGADRQFGVHHQHGGNQHGSGISLLHSGRSLSLIAHFDAFFTRSMSLCVVLCRFFERNRFRFMVYKNTQISLCIAHIIAHA